MRIEPYGVGSFVHVMKRGARGLPITRSEADCWRFARLLYYVNDEYRDELWERSTAHLGMFERPAQWPKRRPLTHIFAWTLMSNHFHLLLKEVGEGGVAKFMQRLCGSMSMHFNVKYEEKGSLFQGAYKGRTITSDQHLRQIIPYIMIKNVFERYPGGYKKALKEFNRAYQWAESYPFSSLPEYMGRRAFPIIEPDIVSELFPNARAFRAHAQETVNWHIDDLNVRHPLE